MLIPRSLLDSLPPNHLLFRLDHKLLRGENLSYDRRIR